MFNKLIDTVVFKIFKTYYRTTALHVREFTDMAKLFDKRKLKFVNKIRNRYVDQQRTAYETLCNVCNVHLYTNIM